MISGGGSVVGAIFASGGLGIVSPNIGGVYGTIAGAGGVFGAICWAALSSRLRKSVDTEFSISMETHDYVQGDTVEVRVTIGPQEDFFFLEGVVELKCLENSYDEGE